MDKKGLVFVTIVCVGTFSFFPLSSRADLTLPTTPCDQQQIDFQIYGVNQHLSPTSQREDGTRAFNYGASGQPFVLKDNNGAITFHFRTIFTAPQETTSYVKLVGFDAGCTAIFGLGPAFSNPASPADHVLTYADSGYTVTLDGQTQNPLPSGTARYIWIEVWDGVTGSQAASYSYAVDVQNPENPSGEVGEPSGNRPVLIVPGILGTEMFRDLEELWANPKMANPLDPDTFMDPLQFSLTLNASDPSVYFGGIIRQRPFFNYSQGLIDVFISQGFIENQTLFTFPYDWRYGLTGTYPDGSTNAVRLQLKIQEILNQTHFQKINIIAHSMGGLVVKQYVMNHPEDHHINKAVFVGVPNTGAPKAVKILVAGDNFNVLGLSDAEMKKIAQNLPVVYDLAPSQKYYDDAGSFVRVLAPNSLGLQTISNLNYDQTRAFLLTDHGSNETAYNNAQILHTFSFDTFDVRAAGVDLYTITGCKTGTLGQYLENRLDGTTPASTSFFPKVISGDGTVPYDSANTIPADDDKRLYAVKPDHGKMPSQAGIRQVIVNLIAGSSLAVGNNIITREQLLANPDLCKINGKGVKVLSPVDIEVIDNLGNRLGFASDGSLQNDIPGADFEVSGNHKFVFLPQGDGETYTINLTGMDTGAFTIQEQDITNDVYGNTQVFPSLAVTQSLKGTLDINSVEPVLNLDTDGDDIIDQIFAPVSVLNPDQSQDLISPTTTASIAGTQGRSGFYRSDVTVTLAAEDPSVPGHEAETSGILKTEYRIDGGGWQECTPSPLPPPLTPPLAGGESGGQGGGNSCAVEITSEAAHTLEFYSIDRASNTEATKTLAFTIDKAPPEAVIQFDPQKKDLTFSGADNLSTPDNITVADAGDTITMVDQAGNTTELKLKDKNRKITLKAEIKSLSYNSQAVDIAKNRLAFLWLYDKKGNLKLLTQNVQAKNGFNILATYAAGKTLLIGRDKTGKIFKISKGLTLLKVATNKGDLIWGY